VKQYKNCNAFGINCLTVSPDAEHFMCSDDLTINMWNIENTTTAYRLVDLRPQNGEELTEIITHVEYHPKRPEIFAFSSSQGYMTLVDTRQTTAFGKSCMKF
jgi:WD40 repeat protein